MSLAIDHVILCMPDLDAAAHTLFEAHGLASVSGGRHPGHGTGNRIVPLGGNYVELMGIVDPAEASTSPMGRWVADEIGRGTRLLAVCLRTDDIVALGERLGLEPLAMSRATPSGETLSWRLVGLDRALGPDHLPFFIQWDDPARHPGGDRAAHRVKPEGIAWVELGGDPGRIRSWLGDHDLDLRLAGGPPGLRAIGIRTAAGVVELR
jgi:hypothetical protein